MRSCGVAALAGPTLTTPSANSDTASAVAVARGAATRLRERQPILNAQTDLNILPSLVPLNGLQWRQTIPLAHSHSFCRQGGLPNNGRRVALWCQLVPTFSPAPTLTASSRPPHVSPRVPHVPRASKLTLAKLPSPPVRSKRLAQGWVLDALGNLGNPVLCGSEAVL